MNLLTHTRMALTLSAAMLTFVATSNAQDSTPRTTVLHAKKAASSGLDSAMVRSIAQMISDSFGAAVPLIEEFIYEAKQLEKDEKVPATAFIGIAILESTGFTSYLYQNAKNPFGMRATSIWKGPTFIMFHEGKDSKFRKYDTPRDAVRDFAVFLNSRKWFRDAFECEVLDVECFIKGLSPNWKKKEPGYASDPEWPNKVRRVIRTYKLEQLKN
ncbi:MAG: glucosaminidase domain-containing protein [Saprospiraceae bacterium]|nr:glucosaminidase domain-containing protein [Saprospiraceae bacterium]